MERKFAPIELWILILNEKSTVLVFLRLVWYQNSLLFNPIQCPVPHSLKSLDLAIISIKIYGDPILQIIYLRDLLLDLLYLLEMTLRAL